MIVGALIDLGADRSALEAGLRKLPLPDFRFEVEEVLRRGLRARKFTPRFTGEGKSLRTLGQVKEALRQSRLEASLVREAEKVFERLAEAEGAVHGKSAGTVHFHELGSPDTLVDVVGALIAWRNLGITEGYASAVNLGGGRVGTSHGVLPVPAPATARLLEGWPVYSDGDEGEKTTPTGAVLVTHLCRPEAFPRLRLEKVGCGAGEKEFGSAPNFLQVLLGERDEAVEREEAVVIETNVDDLSPQILGYLTARLLEAGAMESFVTPVVMKKGRPGHLVTVLAAAGKAEALGEIIFRETGSLGYRFHAVGRVKLARETKEVRTRFGSARVKIASLDGKEVRRGPEYEDCRRLARESGRPLREIIEEVARRGTKEE
jgi:uncharacterized protein (TIGR00299 family) protein